MSILKRLFGRDDNKPEAQSDATAIDADNPNEEQGDEAQKHAAQLAHLRRLGHADGSTVSQALAILSQNQNTVRETATIAAVVTGIHASPMSKPELDALRTAGGRLLELRGKTEQALALTRDCTTVEGMMLAAELYAVEGQTARALSTIERVLAVDIDAPGARDQQERWARLLGRRARPAPVDDSSTMLAPSHRTERVPYRLVREAARGGAGTIYQAEDPLLGRRLAFKVYHAPERDRQQLEREASTAVLLRGPGVLPIYDADPSAGWIASEWIAEGSLSDLLKPERCAELWPMKNWLKPLLLAVARVHDRELVHADLKPANILLRELSDPLLSDFGIARGYGEAVLTGTPGYLSPERLDGGVADPRDDVYALGRIIEDVLTALARQPAAALPPMAPYRDLAARCLADASERPANAKEVLSQLLSI